MSFYLVNERRFPLPVKTGLSKGGHTIDLLPYYRWEHRVTVGYNGQRYMVFLDNLEQKVYIEDCTDGLEQLKDDDLWKSIFLFATQKGYLMIMPPLLKDSERRFI